MVWNRHVNMNPIVGEFTIISGSNPADFHTTFPRAVRLDEGYEIALKGISHGPLNNLSYSKVKLCKKGVSKELNLQSDRFYETPSEILIELHRVIEEEVDRIIQPSDDTDESIRESSSFRYMPLPELYEKDGYMTMELAETYWIELNENMFLNRPFKYKIYERETGNKKRAKTSEAVRLYHKVNKEVEKLVERIENLEEYTDLELKQMLKIMAYNIDDIGKKTSAQDKKMKEHLSNMDKLLTDLAQQDNLKILKTDIELLKKDISLLEIELLGDLSEEIESVKESSKRDIEIVEKRMNAGLQVLQESLEDISETLGKGGFDPNQKYAVNTFNIEQIAVRRDRPLKLIQLSVPIRPIVKTDLAFLYSSVVENSLINNRESRLLTTIPITSTRGYNYFQFAQPIYRLISVRQFSDIRFQIYDKNGELFKFNLYGDDYNKGNREYPTILNLHIRKSRI